MVDQVSPIHRAARTLRALAAPGMAAAFVAAAGVAAAMAASAAAQQEFTLTDEDVWKQTKAVDPTTPEGQLAEARRLLAAGEPERARTLAADWIEKNAQHPLEPEAYLIRADATAAAGDEYEALYDYEFIARVYPASEVFVTALQRELDIAKRYAAGGRRKLWGMRIAGADDEAEELLIRVQERLPGSRLAEEAGMALGDFYFARRKMGLAADAYDLFIANYPRSAQIDKARRRLIYAQLAGYKGPEFDAKGLQEARGRLLQLQSAQPAEAQRMGADALLVRIDEQNALKLLHSAHWYLRVDNAIAADMTLRRLLRSYPRTASAAEARRLVAEIRPQLSPKMHTSPGLEPASNVSSSRGDQQPAVESEVRDTPATGQRTLP